MQQMHEPWPLPLAVVYIRLGRTDEARAIMSEFTNNYPDYTLQDEARWPLKEPLEQGYLDDLRKAGMPER